MGRHRGVFNRDNTSPYELSRSRIENFVRCPACFYMQQVQGIKFPSIPGFNLNEATDVLLKRDFDKCRSQQTSHAFLETHGLGHLVPFQHEQFEKWTSSLHFGVDGYFNWVDTENNLKIGGGLDDVWRDTVSNLLFVVDYKSTSQKTAGKKISLDDKWKAAYKRQMDIYVHILSKMGFEVSPKGYFLYCDGDRFTDQSFLQETSAMMQFKVDILEYDTNTSWIKSCLRDIKTCLTSNTRPQHSAECEHGRFLEMSAQS